MSTELQQSPDETSADKQNRLYVQPAYTVRESGNELLLKVDLPGVTREGLDINEEGDFLHLTARRAEAIPEKWKVIHKAYVDHDYRISLRLSRHVDPEAIKAELKDGVLHLTMSKRAAAQPRKIEVK